MPTWANWVTLGLALLGAGLGVINTLTNYRRGAIRWRIRGIVEPPKDGAPCFTVELENPGRVPVSIKQVFLARSGRKSAQVYELWTDTGHPTLPRTLQPGKALAFGPISRHALNAVLVDQPLTIVAESEDRRRIQVRCPRLREVYAQLQSAVPGK